MFMRGNCVFSDRADPAGTLKMIDYGRARVFVGIKGHHVPAANKSLGSLNPLLLSPWELEGLTISRRDDMYRLSELLVKQ